MTVPCKSIIRFQSTLPRRERQDIIILKFHFFIISIHTPTKGATFFAILFAVIVLISIHTPTKGATTASGSSGIGISNFNPHSHEGSDFPMLSLLSACTFQSTLPRRERPIVGWFLVLGYNFNPHSHEGSD